MPQAHAMPPQDLDDILRRIGLVSINQEPSDTLVGSDVPVKPRMIIRKTCVPYEQHLELWEKHATKPAVSIPIHRRSYGRVLRSTKAVALLDSGADNPLCVSVSGWDSTLPYRQYQLSASESVAKVRKMCREISHNLESDRRCDQGQPGRYQACHAEKQLLADLFGRQGTCKKATIHMNKEPCKDCHRCLKAFVIATGIVLVVVVHGENDGSMSAAVVTKPENIRYLMDGVVVR